MRNPRTVNPGGCATALPGSLDGAIDRLVQCDLRADTPFVAERGEGLALHCVLAGAMQAEIDGDTPIAMPCGSALLLPAGLGVRFVAAKASRRGRAAGPDTRVMIAGISPRAAASLGLGALRAPLVHDVSLTPGAAAMMAALAEELDRPALGTIPLVSAWMKTCLIHAARGLSNGASAEGSRVGQAVSAVLRDPGAPHSIGSLAEMVRMSRATFIRHFARVTGSNPMRFVSQARLDHAAELLRSTDLPIKTVAARIGFSDRSHFSRAFRRAHGVDPTAFRKALGSAGAMPREHASAPSRSR